MNKCYINKEKHILHAYETTYSSVILWALTRNMNPANNTRIQPSADLDMRFGKMGDVQDSIVATWSIVENAFGIEAMHSAQTVTTTAIDCVDGLVFAVIDLRNERIKRKYTFSSFNQLSTSYGNRPHSSSLTQLRLLKRCSVQISAFVW